MSLKIVTYDLGGPEDSDDYKKIGEYIRGLDNWCKPAESFWIVDTTKTSTELKGDLKRYMDTNDKLLVIKFHPDGWASKGLGSKVNEWLHTHL